MLITLYACPYISFLNSIRYIVFGQTIGENEKDIFSQCKRIERGNEAKNTLWYLTFLLCLVLGWVINIKHVQKLGFVGKFFSTPVLNVCLLLSIFKFAVGRFGIETDYCQNVIADGNLP